MSEQTARQRFGEIVRFIQKEYGAEAGPVVNLYAVVIDIEQEAIAKEREACAAIADHHKKHSAHSFASGAAHQIAKAIRARGAK